MLIYQLLIRLLSPIIGSVILLEAVKKHGGLRFFLERLGLHYKKNHSNNPIWIHCASVGEVNAADPIIREVLNNNTPLLLTTNTPTGYRLIEERFKQQLSYAYCPLDYPYAIRHFIRQYHPKKLWVMETEIWPNLYQIASKQGIEISLLNARLSKKTLNSPKWLQKTYKQTLKNVSHLLARNQQEADNFLQLGAPNDNIQVIGNLKYAALNHSSSKESPLAKPFILLASSHHNEEVEIAQRWLKLNRSELLVIVPRHPKRAKDIVASLPLSRERLSLHSAGENVHNKTAVYVDDRIGILMPYFCHAQLVIMGGAFVPKGGHNVLEPASCGAAILTGPDMSDFEDETLLLKTHGALVQCPTYDALFDELKILIDSPKQRKLMGEKAKIALQKQNHILADYLSILLG